MAEDSGLKTTTPQPMTFAQCLTAGRERAFVGRAGELQAFDSLLDENGGERLWFIVGPGGIGKTTLLHSFRAHARKRSVPCAFIDARNVRANPPDVLKALGQATGHQALAHFCAGHSTPILMIDTFERWEHLEGWLREKLLPGAPGNLRVVIAGRNEPGQAWRHDPGWQALTRVSTLQDLDADEADEYLTRRGISHPSKQTLLSFAAGRPLVLALGADMVAQGQSLHTRADTRPIIERLVARFTSDAQAPMQRQALDSAAIVRTLNQDLLAGMLDIDDAGPLYQWLSRLSFMETGPDGIFPHDLVRETLMADMARRYPGRYETGVLRAFDWIVEQIEATNDLSWAEAARLAGDGMYALRELKVVQHFLYPEGVHALYIEPATKDEWPVLADMVAHHEGGESRHWFEFWCQRFPDQVFVVRGAAGSARGLFLRLDMENLTTADRDADPLTALLWQHLSQTGQPDDRAHLPFIRFWLAAEHWQSQSAEKTAILMAINSYNLMAKHLRLTAQVFRDDPAWVMQAQALGIDLLEGSDTRIGDTTWRLYLNDWHRESPTRYYRHFAERCIAFDAALAGASIPKTGGGQAWPDETTFRSAVHEALKHHHTTAALSDNRLLGSALILASTGRGTDSGARIRMLRREINQAVDALANAPGNGLHHARLLRRTYLGGALSQKQAASTLGMGYSTYRRHLAEAREALASELWQAELHRR